MVSIIEAIILGAVQGITEWLPISSSGHLVLFQNLFGIEQPLIFDVLLHLGSLAVVLLVFWKEILALLSGLFGFEKKAFKFVIYLMIASIPIALTGYFFNDFIKSIFHSNLTVGISLLITAGLLFMSKYPLKKEKKLGFFNTIIIGLFQAMAILPGLSRSGATISAGFFQGVKRREAAFFSFMLFIPAIIGATVLEIRNIGEIGELKFLLIGVITVVIVGYLSLKLLLHIINHKKFHYFAWYCLGLGLILILST
ncbi:MAG: undecaprenyl-diphosphate phosphatase [Candidatus Woesearchaeota archaeon]